MHRLDLLFIVCLKTQASIQVCLQEIPLDLRCDCVVHRCYPWLTGFSGSTWHLSSQFAATEPKPEACKSWLLTLFEGLWSRKLVSKKKSLRTVYLLNNTSRCYIKHCGENTSCGGETGEYYCCHVAPSTVWCETCRMSMWLCNSARGETGFKVFNFSWKFAICS